VAEYSDESAPAPDDSEADASPARTDEQLIEEALARFKLAEEAEAETRREALADLEFAAGKQWPEGIVQERERDNRPCLVVNRIPQFIQQVTNDQRQNRPSIKVHAVDDQADPETAKIYQGLIRHIEYNSSADTAYDTAFDSAVRARFGFFRILTQYVSPLSFEQEIIIKRVRDRFSAYLDPHHVEPDGSDANWGFVFEDISKDDFKSRFPKAKLSGDGEWESEHAARPEWVKSDTVRIAEYFYKEFNEETLLQIQGEDGAIASLLAKDLKEQGVSAVESLTEGSLVALPTGEQFRILRTRKTPVPSIKWCKLNGCEILEKTDWPGSHIPIIPVYGNEQIINGKRVIESLVTHAKDSQRMYNYWKSAETEAIALAPRAPFAAPAAAIKGYEAMWASANRANYSYLPYHAYDEQQRPIPAPQRQAIEPAVGAITQAAQLAAEDLKATTGIYDAALGARSNETSGIAIARRNQQAQTSNFHFIDNLTRSLKHAGRILVDLIPKIYDSARVARIIGEDGEQKIVQLNQEFEEGGEMRAYMLSKGKYDVTVDVGPSFASKRQEAAQAMIELSRSVPQLGQAAPDLLVKTFDFHGVKELAERLKKILPPGLADDDKDKKPLPPEVQAQMAQMNQMVEQLTGKLNELQSERETKILELESKERIKAMELETQLEIERARLDAKDGIALLQAQINEIKHRSEQFLRMNEPVDPQAQMGSPEIPDGQELPPEPDGAMSADVGMGEMNPTGGEPPGQIPGEIHDDPSAF
jgi:hypothetical protein